MANPSCFEPQEREVSVVEENGSQETTSIQGQGCSEENNIKKALSREECCVIKDKEGSKARDEGINFCAPEKESPSSKSLVKIHYVAELDDAGVKDGLPTDAVDSSGNNLRDDIQAGEKSKCPPRASGLKLACIRVEDEGEDDIRAERSVKSDGKGLENIDGTRAESSGREHHYCLESRAVKSSGSAQIFGEGQGSGIFQDPGLDSGLVLDSIPDMGLNYRATQCPDSITRASLNGFTIHEPICFKAQAQTLKTRLSQDLFSRPVETTERLEPISSSSETGQEGNASTHGEEDKLREDVVQAEGHKLKKRYDDNTFLQPISIPFSIFGRPLLSRFLPVWGIHYRRRLCL